MSQGVRQRPRAGALAGAALVAGLSFSVVSPPPALEAQGLAAAAAQGRNVLRAVRLLESGEIESGEIEIAAELAVDETPPTLSVQATDLGADVAGSEWVLTLVSPAVDADALIEHRALTVAGSASGWSFRAQVPVSDDFQDVALAVEELATGRWGAVLVDLVDDLTPVAAGLAPLVSETDSAAAPAGPPTHTTPTAPATPAPTRPRTATQKSVGGDVIRLVPPAKRPATGRVRFRTVVTMEGIREASFYLDGEKVESDQRAPFAATLDLGPSPRARVVRVDALGPGGLVLGSDEITINLDQQPFAVRILALEPRGESTLITAEVSIPPGETLDRLEFYKNDALITTVRKPPFEAAIQSSTAPSDFVRVLAHLADGTAVEDARLLSDQAISERIEVNLVEVYAVVSDREGRPIDTLERSDFRLRQGRREVEIERFALADEVPLVLGLIIDSSESMDFLMDETKRAAARFLSQTVLDDDRAFLIDFDSQPRLAQGLTPEVGELATALNRVRVGGNTAIYDAIIYSMAQFEREPGRRALVLLTDGRDYGSKFGPKRCLEEARRLGVPVYIVAINDVGSYLPGAWMQKKPKKAPLPDAFLEGFSEDSGGRLFSITDIAELADIYDIINAELRSQYLLAYSTGGPLSDKELRSIEVDVQGRGRSVRTVVLDR